MKNIWAEFKKFITRGNVIDLAVGMIIGAAFTAIVTALVNGIFKPLINAIPLGDIEGLITMLVPRDANGAAIVEGSGVAVDLSKSVYIDWSAFIMAVINFLLTAIVLFIIIKAINTVRLGLDAEKINLTKEEIAELKKQGKTRKQIKQYATEKEARVRAEAEAKAEAEKPETQEQILADIRALLKANAGEAENVTAVKSEKSE